MKKKDGFYFDLQLLFPGRHTSGIMDSSFDE